ncbi:hypothetical protein C8A05DRAFT_14947 [Staphylotrichum tortipilum]|uniref:SWIM-type domain-containing protein n=1 Tax=Staphylotrichum tortipilum TaxID=2831512 RepID=A0AAN6RTQ6_9PEZI|nr:hypothetical protein C8A05DRAFT_14947 [Staphylotrichum longicolle]
MSLSPTTGMSRLSLEGKSAVSQHHSRLQSAHGAPSMSGPDHPSDSSDWEAEDDEDDEDTDVVSAPTGLKYNLSRLSPRTRQVAQGLFSQTASNESPQISLEFCGIREEDPSADGGLFYAFQMHEVVPCSVRIGARDSGRFSAPRCECPDARFRHVRPCKHLIWLFDKISKQVLFDHDPEAELTLTELGYPEELGDPYDQISQLGLGILADNLRCDFSEPDSELVSPSAARVKEAREMVAALAGIHPYEQNAYRLDLEASYNRNSLIRRGDLGATLFSLILASDSFAEWVRCELSPSDPAVDPFRGIQQRASNIIRELNAFSAAEQDPTWADAYRHRWKGAGGPRNAGWAITQIQHCVAKIEKLVSRGSSPLSGRARSSAARSLVGILKLVVDHQELYDRLVGAHDTGFVYSTLDMLADQSQFIEALEEIMERIGVRGAPSSYVANMRHLIGRMRSHKTEDTGVTSGSGIPRNETPPLSEPPPVQAGPSRPGTVRFVTPELPENVMGRGSQGRGSRGRGAERGAKRPVPRGSQQDNPRGSKKRARGL